MPEIRLMTWNPGHFHAALVQKEMMPGVAPTGSLYSNTFFPSIFTVT